MVDPSDFSYSHSVNGDQLLASSGSLRRTHLLAKRIDSRSLYFLQDGAFSHRLFQEVSACYINGQFVAAIVLGFSFIERALAGRLHHAGKVAEAKGTSESLIETAVSFGWLTEQEHTLLTEIRQFRNPIVHFREPLHQSRPEVQAILQAKTQTQFFEAQATKVIDAMIHVLNYTAI